MLIICEFYDVDCIDLIVFWEKCGFMCLWNNFDFDID